MKKHARIFIHLERALFLYSHFLTLYNLDYNNQDYISEGDLYVCRTEKGTRLSE